MNDDFMFPSDWQAAMDAGKMIPAMDPLDFISNHHLCPNCNGTGSVMAWKIEGGPFPTPGSGRSVFMKLNGKAGYYVLSLQVEFCPVCKKGEMQNYLAKRCGLSGPDLSLNLQGFKIDGKFLGKTIARETAVMLLSMNQRPNGFVTFHGGYGVGKSRLLKTIVNGFRQVGVVSVYTTMADLLDSIRERFGENIGPSSQDLIAYYRRIRVLAVDEFDRVNMTPWAQETMFRLMDSRFNDRETMLTILATNTDPASMGDTQSGAYMQYLKSRILGGTVVEVGGADVRQFVGTALPAMLPV